MIDNNLNKGDLRRKLRRIRRALSDAQQDIARKGIVTRIHQLPIFQKARHVAYYQSFDGEVDVSLLGEDQSKIWYLPITSDHCRAWEPQRLLFQAEFEDGTYRRNQYGIQEPFHNPHWEMKPAMLDVVLLPLVGFDRTGSRLGMGKGYYDRTFASCNWRRPLLVGIAHAEQECEKLERQPWDIPLDMIITGSETIDCRIKSDR